MDKPCHRFAVNIRESDPAITAYATHPYMVSLAEELMGSEARIVEMNAHINSRDPDNTWEEKLTGFHRGTDVPYAGHTHDGLFHCNFVKTLTNLTDLGPDDGGTAVIAGSHKIDAPANELIALAEEDRSLVHQVVAPAGSTLLFCETLAHATGPIRSDRERIIIITGYGSTMFPYWDHGELSPGFRERIPEQLKVLFEGKQVWTRGARYRHLATPADERGFAMGEWDDRPRGERRGSAAIHLTGRIPMSKPVVLFIPHELPDLSEWSADLLQALEERFEVRPPRPGGPAAAAVRRHRGDGRPGVRSDSGGDRRRGRSRGPLPAAADERARPHRPRVPARKGVDDGPRPRAISAPWPWPRTP